MAVAAPPVGKKAVSVVSWPDPEPGKSVSMGDEVVKPEPDPDPVPVPVPVPVPLPDPEPDPDVGAKSGE